ncbi:KEOPS complex subunit Cgi121 [Methanobrevibacter sp. V74]|uniref:KEOPS complex subunit Cgi121 n=1 Tax=Methanobrevibacter sp. V74 TaxID=3064279 RepID=UPI0027333996|nr:KEOPS complex subunit Cgi121 [Methanobrevibacter sp. V74]
MISVYMDNIIILGFKASIDSVGDILNKINSIKQDGEIIQLLNAESIVSKNHIIHGVNQAFLAFNRGENLANDISVEIVLRCSAQRQISKAFKMLGLKEGEMNLCAVLINSNDYTNELSSMFNLDNNVLIPNEKNLMEIYDINDVETQMMSLEEVIIDRITKLTVDY